MSKIIGAALLAAALAVVAYGQAIPDDRIVGCYVGTWANYRYHSCNMINYKNYGAEKEFFPSYTTSYFASSI